MSNERTQTDAAEAELLTAVARGDERAFAAIYDRYSSILFGLLLRIVRDRPEAEDVLQEVFLQIWQQAANFDPARGRAFTWLVTLARSRAIDRLRSREARERTANAAAQEAVEEVGDALADAVRAEQSEVVRGALAAIPEEQRRALVLAYFEGLSQTEIAERTGQPLGTVKTRMRAGLHKLRDLLRRRVEEPLTGL
ncbi:MAG TPA: sigma-70 family RNA polymerase sigma factor [Pyrinomonadaceae bacterium]|nr:sigma-70 family RNA polymerase sigma factor [Pyrinomonadaceae bacterium]